MLRSLLLLIALSFAAPVQAAPCRLALVLAVDVSSSIDSAEYDLQMKGLAAALLDPVVEDAILNGSGTVSAMVLQWSGFYHQERVVPWRVLDSANAIATFAASIAAAPRSHAGLPTALGKGLQHSAYAHADNPVICDKLVIDLSGDGVNNRGVEPQYFADQGLFDGITINGLAIRGATPDPDPYFRQHVARGPGAFVIAANSYEDYPRAIRLKLLREVTEDVGMLLRR